MPNYPPLQAIGAAVYTRLNSDATLTALAPVVNDAAEDQAFPYVLMGRPMASDWSTLGGTSSGWGWKVEIIVAAYSRYQGDLEAIQVIERVVYLLNHYAFTVSGYATVICALDPDQAPAPIALKLEYPNKVEQRVMPARFCFWVHE